MLVERFEIYGKSLDAPLETVLFLATQRDGESAQWIAGKRGRERRACRDLYAAIMRPALASIGGIQYPVDYTNWLE
ncbi:hypothetical protein D7S89_16595 [Trinickia fusca]|uniref:Uncharacterized protein n=1 Tax=Trinickia fusca TaxID=2419777 RepID=A0A494X8B8_9BURK|nr:hypothetical protein D7S89_16595 [Trinickia fusca]